MMKKKVPVNKVHGHEVMHMMIRSGKQYTKEQLEQEIIKTFGEDTRFYTCSANDMSALELIEFLDARGKFLMRGDRLTTNPEKICKH